MKKMITAAVMGTLLAIGVGCGAGGYPSGFIYNGTTTPHGMDKNEVSGAGKAGEKTGESCATGILGLIGMGDASLDAAKKAAGVTDLSSVEMRNFSILGLYTQGCTVVHGK